MSVFITFIDILCQVLLWAIVIRSVLSWFPIRPDNPLLVILHQLTEPIFAPLRRIVPRIGILDITPMVAIFLLWLLSFLIHTFLS